MIVQESDVAGVWGEALGCRDVDVEAGFFELGGDSILMLELISLLDRRLGLDVDVVTLLEHSSVAGFTAHWNAQGTTTGSGR